MSKKMTTGREISAEDRAAFLGGAAVKTATTKSPTKARLFRLYAEDEARIGAAIERGISAGVRPPPSKTAIVRAALLALEALDENQLLDVLAGRQPQLGRRARTGASNQNSCFMGDAPGQN